MITIDFGNLVVPLRRELHGSNGAIHFSNAGVDSFEKEYERMRFTIARTHDWPLWNNGQRCIDTHFVFPLEHLDPSRPENYVFGPTDEIIRRYAERGVRILYRLGTSIEHSDVHFNALMPKDFDHYAEILAGIVRHYTRGWANGFRYDMMFEIWNEADLGPKMWSGTLPEFERFFVTVLARLKREFPDVIIGGPAYTTHYDLYLKNLLRACADAHVAPDFLSWHSYAYTPDYLMEQARLVRKLLDDNGFPNTKTCLDEWHNLESWDGLSRNTTPANRRQAIATLHGTKSAVFHLAALSGWQSVPMDMACYYGTGPNGTWGYYNADMELDKNYYAMCLYGDFLQRHAWRCAAAGDDDGTLYPLAATDQEHSRFGLLLSDWDARTPQFRFEAHGLPEDILPTATILDEESNGKEVPVSRSGSLFAVEHQNHGPTACALRFEQA